MECPHNCYQNFLITTPKNLNYLRNTLNEEVIMLIYKIIKKLDFYKLLHPLTLVVTFPIFFTTFCFLTHSMLKGFILYACALIILILLMYLDMITETESLKKDLVSITCYNNEFFLRRWLRKQ